MNLIWREMSHKEQIFGASMGAGGPGGSNIRLKGVILAEKMFSVSKRYNPYRKFPCRG